MEEQKKKKKIVYNLKILFIKGIKINTLQSFTHRSDKIMLRNRKHYVAQIYFTPGSSPYMEVACSCFYVALAPYSG